jgi:hypothetical protein
MRPLNLIKGAKQMKAVVMHEYGGPDVLKYEDVPDPVPGKGEVLVRIAEATINPVDLWQRAAWEVFVQTLAEATEWRTVPDCPDYGHSSRRFKALAAMRRGIPSRSSAISFAWQSRSRFMLPHGHGQCPLTFLLAT